MTLKLKKCSQCGKRKRIGASKSRCKACRIGRVQQDKTAEESRRWALWEYEDKA